MNMRRGGRARPPNLDSPAQAGAPAPTPAPANTQPPPPPAGGAPAQAIPQAPLPQGVTPALATPQPPPPQAGAPAQAGPQPPHAVAPAPGVPAHGALRQGVLAQAEPPPLPLPASFGGSPRSPAEKLQPTRPPRPPRGRKPRRKRRRLSPFLRVVNGMLTITLLAMIAAGITAVMAARKFDEPGPLARTSLFAIPKGRGLNAIAARLERDGIISDRRLFVANVYYRGVQGKLKAGEYQFGKHASMNDVIDRVVAGRAVLYKVTLPEGRTSQQIVARLKRAQYLTGDIAEVPAEGALMPDTYKFSRGMSRADLIERMQAESADFLERAWQVRQDGLPFQTKREALILASIVEKETGKPIERPHVAAVFVNRLRRGMKLQSDPTIIYGLVGGRGRLGHPIRRKEINQRTAYNTYHINALPPTPICNPGRAAIEAVLNPAKSEDLYFVADGTGGHVFAKTLAGHNANVRRWRKLEKAIRRRQKAKRARASALGAKPKLISVAAKQKGAAATGLSARNTPAAKSAPAIKIINSIAAAAIAAADGIPLPVRKPAKRRTLKR